MVILKEKKMLTISCLPQMVLEVMRYRKGACGLATSHWSGVEFNQLSGCVIQRSAAGHQEEERSRGSFH